MGNVVNNFPHDGFLEPFNEVGVESKMTEAGGETALRFDGLVLSGALGAGVEAAITHSGKFGGAAANLSLHPRMFEDAITSPYIEARLLAGGLSDGVVGFGARLGTTNRVAFGHSGYGLAIGAFVGTDIGKGGVSFEAFVRGIGKQADRIRAKSGCAEVDLRIVVADDQVQLKARPRKS